MATATASALDATRLTAALRDWGRQAIDDWDSAVDEHSGLPGGADLWNGMPAIDSKAVAESSPLFEEHLGVALDITFIRPGGYHTLDDMIGDIVPKMMELAVSKSSRRRTKGVS